MNREVWIRVAVLYFPITAALIAGSAGKRLKRQFLACLLSALWVTPGLLIVHQLNVVAHWWQFSPSPFTMRGMPLEAYIGWVALWGILPQLVLRRLHWAWCAVLFVVLDLLLMPACSPVIVLGPDWLVGEFLAAVVVLVPALCIGRWALEGSHLRARTTMQIVISALIFLYLIPEIAFALRGGEGWGPLLLMPGWQLQLAIQCVFLIAVPGISAAFEFAERGGGTPIPFDPPRRLVTSGIFRYCANPMQVSCTVVMFVWALLLANQWLLLAGMIAASYGSGVADWDERQDLLKRFGSEWSVYRAAVKNWRFRWKPYHSGAPAKLYIAMTCGPCSELRRWIEARRPLGLDLVAAESLPAGSIRRLRYEPGDGTPYVEGVRAFGRALEHINFGWAFAGMVLRLPLVWRFIQLVMDASGFGPRRLEVDQIVCTTE